MMADFIKIPSVVTHQKMNRLDFSGHRRKNSTLFILMKEELPISAIMGYVQAVDRV